MIAAFLFVGSICGFIAGITVLLSGHSIWFALLAYLLAGSISTVAMASLYLFLGKGTVKRMPTSLRKDGRTAPYAAPS